MGEVDLLIMGTLILLAIIFMMITVFHSGPVEGSITTLLWFTLTLYYPTFQPAIPELAYLFFGLGLIFLIVTFKAALDLLGGRKSKRWSTELD